MPYASLRDFIARLESSGRLVRVKTPVSTELELTEIQTRPPRRTRSGGDLRECHHGEWPALPHAGAGQSVRHGRARRLGTMDREPTAQLREVGETLAFLKQPEPPGGWREAVGMLPLLKTVLAMKPKTVRPVRPARRSCCEAPMSIWQSSRSRAAGRANPHRSSPGRWS